MTQEIVRSITYKFFTDLPMEFQKVIMALQNFWVEKGCLLAQGYDLEVGAGTMSPHTFLRVLGTEPWNVCYVEPCRRPVDGRYGENPNRLQHYYQFQVIMKPAPFDIKRIYLDSLESLGIDLKSHDVRFVEDDWESPTLGAWGLGWEVWLDGLEITQFTYFQQAGGIDLKPISVEITYGLERITMYLQKKENVYDLEWGGGRRYGDIHLQTEKEFSRYNFETADIDGLKKLFDLYEREATLQLTNGLPFPAFDMCLKCSHIFNLLEARGAFSVAERMKTMLRIRELAKRSGLLYLKNSGYKRGRNGYWQRGDEG